MSKKPDANDTVAGLVDQTMTGIASEVAKMTAAEKREAARRERRATNTRRAVMILLPLCVVLTALNLAGFRWFGGGAGQLSPEEARAAATQLLSDAVDELDFFYEENGAYPRVPGFIGPDGPNGEDEPFTYELMGSNRYVLSAAVQGETVSFDSRADADVVFREVRDGR